MKHFHSGEENIFCFTLLAGYAGTDILQLEEIVHVKVSQYFPTFRLLWIVEG